MKQSGGTEEEILVWLVEDNRIFRRGLARAIDSADDLRCAGEFECAEAMLEALQEYSPDVILMDVGLPGMDGLAALKQIRQAESPARVVILTVFNDSDKVFNSICSGANGYLLKTASAQEVVTAIRQAAEGGAPLGAEVAARVLSLFANFAQSAPAASDSYGLSPRETEVLAKMAEGLVTKEIASALKVSNHTVTNHIRSIYTKLHVNTNTGAVAKAIRERLV